MDSKDIKQINRFNTEMHTLRKAEEDTKYFWSCFDINFETCNDFFPNQPSKEELFHSHAAKEIQTIEDNIPVERSGLAVEHVQPIENFDDLIGKVPDFIIENIHYVRYEKPTPVQKHAIPIGMTGRDLIVCSHTGSGKTMAFLIPIISSLYEHVKNIGISSLSSETQDNSSGETEGSLPTRERLDRELGVIPLAIVLAPTRELASQIHREAQKLCYGSPVRASCLYGGLDIRQQLFELSHGSDIIIATPGRLSDVVDRGIISLSQVKIFTMDEADRMLDMGFEPQILHIINDSGLPCKEDRQTILFSATFADEIQELAKNYLNDYVWIGVGRTGSTVDQITQRLELVSPNHHSKLLTVLRLLDEIPGRTLIFVQQRKMANFVCDYIRNYSNHKAEEIHGLRSQSQREMALEQFKSGVIQVLVATDVASRGLDIAAVEHVIQYDLPMSPQEFDVYIHRMGRTGRAGKTGFNTSLYVPGSEPGVGNGRIAPLILRLMLENQQEIPDWFSCMDEARESIANISIKSNQRSNLNYNNQIQTCGLGSVLANGRGRGPDSSGIGGRGGRGGLIYGGHDIRLEYQPYMYSSAPQFNNINQPNSQAQGNRQNYGNQSNSQLNNPPLYRDRGGHSQPLQYNIQNPDYSYASQSYSSSPREHNPSLHLAGSSGVTSGMTPNSRTPQYNRGSITTTPHTDRSGLSSDYQLDKFYSQPHSQPSHINTSLDSDAVNSIDTEIKPTCSNNNTNGNHTKDEQINEAQNATEYLRTTRIPYDPAKYTNYNSRPTQNLPHGVSFKRVDDAINPIEGSEQATLSTNGANSSVTEQKPVLSIVTDTEPFQIDIANTMVSNNRSTIDASIRSNNSKHQGLGRNFNPASYGTRYSNQHQHQTQQFTLMPHYIGSSQPVAGAYNQLLGPSLSYQGAMDPMLYGATQAASGHTLGPHQNNSSSVYTVVKAAQTDQPQAYAYMINSPRPEMYVVPTMAQQSMHQTFVPTSQAYAQQMYYPAQGSVAVNLNQQSMLYPQVVPQISPIPLVTQSYPQAAFQQHQQYYQQSEYVHGNVQIFQQQQQYSRLLAQQINSPPQQQFTSQQRYSTGSQLPMLHSSPRNQNSNSQQNSVAVPALNPDPHQQHQRDELIEHKQN